MSTFYETLDFRTNAQFKARKKAFKKGKPCSICGKLYSSDKMMVAHKIPVRELSDWDALYDQDNWEVRCIYCEREANRKEDIEANNLLNAEKRNNGSKGREKNDSENQ